MHVGGCLVDDALKSHLKIEISSAKNMYFLNQSNIKIGIVELMALHILSQIDLYHKIILHSKAYKHHNLVDDALLLDIMKKIVEIYF